MANQKKTIVAFQLAKLAWPILALYGSSTAAQTRPDAGSLLENQRRAITVPQGGGGLPIAPPPPPRVSAPPGATLTVKEFRISGNTAFTDEELKGVLAGFLNRPLDMYGLNEVLDAVKGYYRERGYFLAVAYLPEQEMRDGIVRVFVLEGRIGKVSTKTMPGSRINDSIAERYLSAITPGALATERIIYSQLLLLQDLPGVTVSSLIKPGEQVGSAELDVEVGDRGNRITGNIEADNYGSKYAGGTQLNGTAFLNSPLGLGDLLTFRGGVAQGDHTAVGTLIYAIPVGRSGTKLGTSYTALRYRLSGVTAAEIVPPTGLSRKSSNLGALRSKGSGDISTAYLLHPFIRARELNLFGQLSGEIKNAEDSSLDTPSSTAPTVMRRRVQSVKVAAFGDSRDGLLGSGLNTFGLTVSVGDSKGLNPVTLTVDGNDGGSDRLGGFTKTNIELQRTHQLSGNAYGIFRLTGQTANRNLPTSEKMAAGGATAVRAYPAGEGAADAGMFASAEVRYQMSGLSLEGAGLELAAFFDAARIRRNINQIIANAEENILGVTIANRRSFAGAGVGLRLAGTARYSIKTDVAWQVGNERAQNDANRSPMLWLQGAMNF